MKMATIQAIEARSVHQIQSGQVIVDLCSVAKELVENSLDAGATTIEIRFKNSGLDLIEVQDNGSGISPENYENVALKHYTSKLSSYDDLSSLHTFGFRGEAISSLCALADFHIVTAQDKQVPRANRLDFEQSGKLQKTQIVAGQKGTTASVEGIFKRLPVRRRELEKNIKREYGKVLNLLHAYACISTGVRFSVRNTVGKTRNVVVFSTNGNKTTKENIANVYGAKTLSALISLDLELEFEPAAATKRAGDDQLSKIQVRGHISRPVFGEGRQTPDRQMFFVNSRPCGLPQIQKAFNEVYKSFNVSQSAFVFADFQMDTNAYDVNVSPDKRQILLHDAGAMIESLKVSLTQLFEDADQSVPQSSVKSRPLSKQQPLASLPGFITARELSESSGFRSLSQDQTKEKLVETPGESQQSTIQRFTSSQGGIGRAQATPSPARSTITPRAATSRSSMSTPAPSELEASAADISDDELFVQTAAQGEPKSTPISREPSSQPSLPDETPSHARGDPKEIPNMVQNAFDRMRPRREPAELATITIGNRTVTSIVGSGPPRKRLPEGPPLMKEPPRRKRRIHTPSRPNIFGEHMKAFAAPGSQLDEDEDEEASASEDDHIEEDENNLSSEIEDTQGTEQEQEAEGSPPPKDGDYVPDQGAAQSEIENTEAEDKDTTADDNLNEAQKKAQEEATVQRLIHEAEETALLPQENSANRAKKMNKGAAHRDATTQLVGTVDGSIPRLQSQLITLQKTLQEGNKKTVEEATDLGEKTAEDKLSLTVSKNDFAQMRIIGQFNLGFIIAVRPGEDHDELFIIDQHASDEKYNFERLQSETVVQNQRLVRPQRLDLTAVEEEVVLENRAALEKNGFLVTVDESGDEPIGRRCQLVSLPLSKEVVFGVRDLEELIVLLSESISTSNGLSVPRPSKVRKMFAMRACRSSIMIGKTLTNRQMERVVQNMGTIDKPWNCPHGRPTMRHLMSLSQWDEWNEFEETEGLDPWKQYLEGEDDEDEE
ncbi:Ribosomal protein S5 domain 2-type fold subgroup [Penicillium cf. griseofulvum]|uniref:DNA mismatch repair protein PMS1 n=1 Tax=Penicillium cf. griseofulvum TaxID=2972120 RepID=A0A9W9J3B2_9EURO|nr:Ribosomal protein S5 domain 2-type fold subgroup [Penicillium cf. griseofulvum]KAJ5434913.1 Ribosomal protein S5 domain 2-type fold subgroup [Penicillium cf. griseofulvum]KAJ5452746.1 Ribosomal protein S5 domain 2-type fold subgroup [Penicillium cf. griseofulvum]